MAAAINMPLENNDAYDRRDEYGLNNRGDIVPVNPERNMMQIIVALNVVKLIAMIAVTPVDVK